MNHPHHLIPETDRMSGVAAPEPTILWSFLKVSLEEFLLCIQGITRQVHPPAKYERLPGWLEGTACRSLLPGDI